MLRRLLLAGCAALTAGCTSLEPPRNEPVTLRVTVFRGASNISLYMAMERGAFSRRGITPVLDFTPNSTELRAGLAAGRFDIAHGGVDNAVAMVEVAGNDAVIVAGGDSGMTEMLVRPEIMQAADLRGHTFVVDAPNTAYALVGRKIFKGAGLMAGRDYKLLALGGTQERTTALRTPDNAAVILFPPWNHLAKQAGAKSMGRVVDLLGPYQAMGVFVMRPWAVAHAGALERYLAAYIEGCRAALDPANREQTLAVLRRELKLEPSIAELSYRELLQPGHGLARDCAFNMDGFRNVLALRAEIEGQWNGTPPPPGKYLDLGYYERALGLAGR